MLIDGDVFAGRVAMGKWWSRVSNLFGAMASAEMGDFDSVREFRKQREMERKEERLGSLEHPREWLGDTATGANADHS
jgi:hypothetical protein